MKYDIPTMTAEAVSLLKSLISIPSISREETQAADFLLKLYRSRRDADRAQGKQCLVPQSYVRP